MRKVRDNDEADDEDAIATLQVRIALSFRLTKRCGKRFHVHQRKDFEPDYNPSTRAKQKMSLEFHIRLDLVAGSY